MSYTYTIYGITLRLPFPCSVLPFASATAVPEVMITEGSVPRFLKEPLIEEKGWQASVGSFLFRGGKHSGRFLVENGTKITMERNPGADDTILAFHFLTAVLAVLLQQRGLLVLHANAALTPNGAVAISGESGAGKSTTLAALLGQGCLMLSDDITALRQGEDNNVEILPGVPQLHLCEDSAEELKQDLTNLPRYPWRCMKAAVPVHDVMATAPVPLKAVYLLRSHPGSELRILSLSGAEKFTALHDCMYGPLLPMGDAGLFALYTSITDQVAMFRVERPLGKWTVDEVTKAILNG